MADRTEGSIEIGADAPAIMAVIADYEAYPLWANGVKKVEVLERDGEGRGKRVHFEVSQGPVKADYTLEYDYAAGSAGVSWTFVEGRGLRDIAGEYVLEGEGRKTKVIYRLRVDSAIPMLGFMKRKAEGVIIDTALKGLKKRVESR